MVLKKNPKAISNFIQSWKEKEYLKSSSVMKRDGVENVDYVSSHLFSVTWIPTFQTHTLVH